MINRSNIVGQFLTHLEMKQVQSSTPIRKAKYQLTRSLIYFSNTLDDTIVVPKGFVTDLASMPRIPVLYTFLGDLAHEAAVLHDFLYCHPHRASKNSSVDVTRGVADSVLLGAIIDGMLLETDTDKRIGYAWDLMNYCVIAYCFYIGVRIGGGKHWVKDRIKEEITNDTLKIS